MNEAQKQLLALVRAVIRGEELPACDRWADLFEIARIHGIGNLFYYAIKSKNTVPSEVLSDAKQHYMANVAQQISQEYYAAELFSAFEEKGIKYMPLKGYYMRDLYPERELRTSCDVDVLYDETDHAKVSEILEGMGFESEGKSINHEGWMKDSVTVEMHHNILSDRGTFAEYYKDVWSRLTTENGTRYQFNDEDFYVYFLAHSAKHFSFGGFGIRTVLDVYFYRLKKTLNQEYLDVELEKAHLKSFAQAIERLASVWFGDQPMDEDMKMLGDYVFDSGAYGISMHSAVMKGVSSEGSVKQTKVAYFFKTLFPGYKWMKASFPVLKKAPFLLPFAWVYRWFYVLFTDKSKYSRALKRCNAIDDQKVNKAKRILEITDIPLD